jgi:hypothetical protein
MELEHAFQQSGFLVAFQLLTLGSLIAPAALGGTILYQRFVRALASYVVSFGPMSILVYLLYKVSQIA